MSDSEKIERLERQTELLQKELKAIRAEIAETKKKAPKVEATQTATAVATPATAAATPASAAASLPTTKSPKLVSLPSFGGVNFSAWGWAEAATVFRDHNTVNDMLTLFADIPYPYSPLYNEHEFHGTARQSQLSLLADANIDASQKLSAYFEIDFLGVGT